MLLGVAPNAANPARCSAGSAVSCRFSGSVPVKQSSEICLHDGFSDRDGFSGYVPVCLQIDPVDSVRSSENKTG